MVYIKRSQKIALCILLALSVLFLCVGCYFALHQSTVIVNFKMPDVEPGAIKIPASEQTQKPGQETPEGGSGGSVTYADQVTIGLSARTISFMFQNPNNSGADMVLHFFAGDQEIASTGLIKGGYEIKSLSLAVPAFAASTEPPTKDIMGSYVAGDNAAVYSYSYHFGDMEFEYVGASSRKWNPQTHQYDEGTSSEGGWRAKTATSGDATVINHSNAPIKVSFGFEAAVAGMSFGASEQGFAIASAEGTTVDNAPSKTVKIGTAADCGNTAAIRPTLVLDPQLGYLRASQTRKEEPVRTGLG